MIFIFSLVIAALLCIASFICYKVSGKMLDEKDAEKCAKEAELEERLMNRIMQTRNKPLSDGQQPRPNRFAGYGRGLRGNP